DGASHASADVWFLAQKGTSQDSLQQQVSGLSSAMAGFASGDATTTAALTQQLDVLKTGEQAGLHGAQAMADAMGRFRNAQGLHGAAAALTGSQRELLERGASGWFAVPGK
ncbi:MAG: hypothetical protein ABW202_22110, partial [Duganella sp.]